MLFLYVPLAARKGSAFSIWEADVLTPIGDSLIRGTDPTCHSSHGSFRGAPQEALRAARAGLLRV